MGSAGFVKRIQMGVAAGRGYVCFWSCDSALWGFGTRHVKVSVGTSGYSYKAWLGNFYPEDLSPKEMLRFYSSRLPAVEINNNFYRLPKESVLASWSEQTPMDFRFVLKAAQTITHVKRLKDAEA